MFLLSSNNFITNIHLHLLGRSKIRFRARLALCDAVFSYSDGDVLGQYSAGIFICLTLIQFGYWIVAGV